MNYHKSSADYFPELVDITSSPTTVYLRKNVREIEVTDEVTSEKRIAYEYDEAIITKDEYINMLRTQTEELESVVAEILYGEE